MKRAASIILSTCLLGAGAAAAAVTAGQPAPAFKGTDVSGKPVSLADFKGKYVVLEWNNPNCPFVMKHYDSGNMQSLQKRFGADNVAWISVNSTSDSHSDYMSPEKLARLVQAAERCAQCGSDGHQGRNWPRLRRQGHSAHVCRRPEGHRDLRRRH